MGLWLDEELADVERAFALTAYDRSVDGGSAGGEGGGNGHFADPETVSPRARSQRPISLAGRPDSFAHSQLE
jgi:hypothetical protein